MKADREPEPRLTEEPLADAEPDFASEHRDMTVGDLEGDGPEHAPEPESPKGYGGADYHRSSTPHKRSLSTTADSIPSVPREPDPLLAQLAPSFAL